MDFDDPLIRMTANTTLIDPAVLADHGVADLSGMFRRLTWIGGRITLTAEYLHFEANRLNRAVNSRFAVAGRHHEYAHLPEYLIKCAEIQQVELRRWMGFAFVELRLPKVIMGVRGTRNRKLYDLLRGLR